MAQPDAAVTVVVVTWNALPWLEQCLESVRGRNTIIVDHGSTDGTLELVRERFPEVRVIALPRNEGFAGAAQDRPWQPHVDDLPGANDGSQSSRKSWQADRRGAARSRCNVSGRPVAARERKTGV